MKIEKPTLEEVERVLGVTLPEAEKGWTWEYSYSAPREGETILNNFGIWVKSPHRSAHKFPKLRPIRTHREDGTPLDIEPLPEIEGYRVEYRHLSEMSNNVANVDKVMCYHSYREKWEPTSKVSERMDEHYALLYKLQKPTTLKDLYPIGNENVWLRDSSGALSLAGNVTNLFGELRLNGNSPHGLLKDGIRWSHSPHTSYEDAFEFVVEGGGDK